MDIHMGTFLWTILNIILLLLIVAGLAYLLLYGIKSIRSLNQRLSNIEEKLNKEKKNQ